SAKPDVRSAANTATTSLITCVDNVALLPFLSGVVLSGNRKIQVALLEKLLGIFETIPLPLNPPDVIPVVHQKKPILVVKHILPLSLSFLEEKRGELRTANQKILKLLYTVMGSG